MTTTQDHRSSLLRRARNGAEAHRGKIAVAAVIVVLCVFTATQSPVFLTFQNLVNVASQISVLGVLACGTTMLMVSRGMDLSIGSSVSLSSMVLASLMISGAPIWVAVVACFAITIAVGATNGILASFSKTHPFVITLGMLTLIQGIALLVSQTPLFGLPQQFIDFGRANIAGIPVLVLVFILVAISTHILLSRSRFGRWLYAIGGGETAAYLAGIRIRAVKITVYALNGILVGLASILLVAQVASASATIGAGLELTTIAAVAVGGTTLSGGKGDIGGTILGVVLLGLIGNALNLMSISPNWQFILQGLVIVVAVMAQREAR